MNKFNLPTYIFNDKRPHWLDASIWIIAFVVFELNKHSMLKISKYLWPTDYYIFDLFIFGIIMIYSAVCCYVIVMFARMVAHYFLLPIFFRNKNQATTTNETSPP
jgi:hypothetical protein